MAENTYKTILFEQFDKQDGNNLKLYLQACDEPASDRMLDKLEKLTVHSFQEFVDKFVPVVYQTSKTTSQGFDITYDFESNGTEGVKITNTPYFQLLENMCQKKGGSRQSNREFDYNEVLESLMPRKVAEKAMRTRQLLENVKKDFDEAEAQGRSGEADEKWEQLNDLFDEVQATYKGNVQGLLPLAIADTEQKIKCLTQYIPETNSDGHEQQGNIGALCFGSQGQLEIRPLPNPSDTTQNLDVSKQDNDQQKERQLAIASYIEEDYDAYVAEGHEYNEFVKDLIVSVFSPVSQSMDPRNMTQQELLEMKDTLNNRKTGYENLYKTHVEKFASQMAPYIEKILAVKLYFQHATVDGRLPKGRGLIVANCTPGDLLEVDVQDKFRKFIKHFGADARADNNGNNKIWLGILPDVNDGTRLETMAARSASTVSGRRERRRGPAGHAAANDGRTSLNDAMQLLNILEESRILTFFSAKGNKDNSFGGITGKYISEQRDKLQGAGIHGEYASYAYPAFTIMNKRTMDVAGDGYEANKIQLTVPGIYLDAAYIAAGLVAGTQQPGWLSSRGVPQKKLAEELPCVHVDLESRELQPKLTTLMNRELTTSWNSDIKAEINKDNFGFAFCGDYFEAEGKPVDNTYVYCARNMKLGDKSHRFMPIYTALVKNYVSGELLKENYRTANEIKKQFVEGKVAGWKKAVVNKPDCINLLLNSGEDISWDSEKGIVISFGENEVFLTDINISNEER